MRFVTVQDLVDLHAQVLTQTGRETGMLTISSLDSAVDRHEHGPFHGAGDELERAAYLLRGIIQDHPFVDGNKRTAIEGTFLFLRLNGWTIRPSADELVTFALSAAQGLDVMAIDAWLRRRAQRINGPGTQEVA